MAAALRRALLVAVVALLGLAGCTVGPSQRPPVAVRGDDIVALPSPTVAPAPAPPELPEPDAQNPAIRFFDCTDDALATLPFPLPPDRTLRVDCGHIAVPADPDQPTLGGTRIGVLRVGLADAPANRPPLLAVGDSATEPSTRHAVTLAGQVPLAVLQRFTLVGVDRRGAGDDALECAPVDVRAALIDADPGTADEAGLTALLEQAREVAQLCYRLLAGDLGGHRTASTVTDVERLRIGLGVTRLSAVGVGDGATALAGWSAAFPTSVGRVVLDGPLDPTRDEPDRSEAMAGALEAAFDGFSVACVARADCPLAPDPRASVTGLLERLSTQPLVAEDGRRLTAGATVTALIAALAEPRGWPALATALAAARSGDPVAMLDVADPVIGPGGRFDAMLATTCNDSGRRLSPGEVGELAARWRTAYPLFGGTLALRLLACTPWPATVRPTDPDPADGVPPVLVIGTARNPRGPLDGARRTAEALPSSRFLSWQGAGTGAYPRTPCVTGVVDTLLVEGKVPEQGLLCPP
ncbi:MAG: alpha/beta hydrolase [Pseudonocardia sp.]